jgi:hypothetical protein
LEVKRFSDPKFLTTKKAIQTAAQVRNQVKSSLSEDYLAKTFGDIEVFLSVFQGDENIEKASTSLLVSILTAVEGVMEFFLSSHGKSRL